MSDTDEHDEEKKLLPSSLDIKFVLHLRLLPLLEFPLTAHSPLKLFDIAKAQGRPLYAAAPMVRYSKVRCSATNGREGI
jgi:hypothetical protein